MNHASPLAMQGKTYAQPWTANWLVGRSRRRSMDVSKLAEVLSKSKATEYEAIVEKLEPKFNTFINNTKA